MKTLAYTVHNVPVESIKPSPENDSIYGAIVLDDPMQQLIDSIQNRGLTEPLIISSDNYIISGHRRYFALCQLGANKIPVYRRRISRRLNLDEWPTILTEHNPQRVKSPLTLLKEAMLRMRDNDPRDLLLSWEKAHANTEAVFTDVQGSKKIGTISAQRREFFEAAQAVITELREYWPLTVRQIHYSLLNAPPLKRVTAMGGREKDRYRNDLSSYKALVRLLTDARYSRDLPMHAIDDPTRPVDHQRGFENLAEFIEQQMDGFLTGYHRDRQIDQTRHVEVLGEKNTLVPILKPVCREYYVPLSISRGYGTVPLWNQIARRFRQSRKRAMSLVVVSDYDPEGLDLADDAVRSLTEQFAVPVDYHRVAVNRNQIDELGLAMDFNPAKPESTRLDRFIEKTGSEDTWECEAIPPNYLQEALRSGIEANMNMDVYRESQEIEEREAEELAELRQSIIEELE